MADLESKYFSLPVSDSGGFWIYSNSETISPVIHTLLSIESDISEIRNTIFLYFVIPSAYDACLLTLERKYF